ncbi:MAG: lipid-A-disaccharide synthase [Rhodanobacteraceae bacterium]|nr:MAG: lipid-A-disaccharide synthase [Rhodanobacteraceae bacterium]
MSPAAGARVFAMVAGEDSGDQLGADLIEALRMRFPGARFMGVGGPRMRKAGFDAWHDVAELSVMGVAEVLHHLPRLLRLRASLARRITRLHPDAFVGIDAPDFNLGLEKKLKRAGIRTVHYVSPSIWAWREGRAEKIGRCADCVLCLFPMEPAIYARHGVDARFVGHPLADRFPLQPNRDTARAELGLRPDAPVLAVLPGSRLTEIRHLGAIFLAAAQRVADAIPGLQIVIPAANRHCRAALEGLLAPHAATLAPTLLDGHAHRALMAADVVLLASGTAALEAMLAKRPMVVGYRIAPLTYALVKGLRMLKTDLYSLPNALAGAPLVPELMQRDCTPARLADAVLAWFRDPVRCAALAEAFKRMHLSLYAGNGAATAASRAIEQLLHPHTGAGSRP